jgi:hypothetical protein
VLWTRGQCCVFVKPRSECVIDGSEAFRTLGVKWILRLIARNRTALLSVKIRY